MSNDKPAGAGGDVRERWRPVVGFEGYYDVSDLGRVRSLHREPALIMRTSWRGKAGKRLGLTLSVSPRREQVAVAAVVLEAFVGPRPTPDHCVCYVNRDRSDVRLVNLRWQTAEEWAAQQDIDGTRSHGERHSVAQRGRAKLTPAAVRAIRRLRDAGHTQQEVAERFGVSQSMVSRITLGKQWKSVKP